MSEPLIPYGTQIVFIAMSTIIAITPVLRYIYAGWRTKRDDIMNSIDDNAKIIYLDKFEKYNAPNTGAAKTEFGRLYHKRFGRRYFVFPVFILAVLVIL